MSRIKKYVAVLIALSLILLPLGDAIAYAADLDAVPREEMSPLSPDPDPSENSPLVEDPSSDHSLKEPTMTETTEPLPPEEVLLPESEPEGPSIKPQVASLFRTEAVTGGLRILGFASDEKIQTTLSIPDHIDGISVVEIGDRAFMQVGLTELTLRDNVRKIGDYAFAGNALTTIAFPDALTDIGDYAFRDNRLKNLQTNKVAAIGMGAFTNNTLTEVLFGDVKAIGNSAFSRNNLTKVRLPDNLEGYGIQVFAYNNRFVLVETNSPLVKTEVVENGFGQVVNPVTITLRFLEAGTEKKLLNDQTFGTDFTDPKGIVILNEEQTYTPPKIAGYAPVVTPVTYTPDHTDYVLTVYYRSISHAPTIEVIKNPFIADGGDGSLETLLSFVKAKDLEGTDITDKITVEPTTVDTSVPGPKKVTYQVEDRFGNVGTRTVDILIGTNWYEFPLGNGWVLGDFVYEGNAVLGFSETGLEKVATQKNLVLPHINPQDGTTVVDTVGVNNNPTGNSFRSRGLESVADYADNIRIIAGERDNLQNGLRDDGAFKDNVITDLDLPNLTIVGSQAFHTNKLTRIHQPTW